MRGPFTLFNAKRKNGLVWSVRFWDAASGKYAAARSTGIPVEGKRERRREAEEAARAMAGEITFSQVPKKEKSSDRLFTDYIAEFWMPDSPYIIECATVKKKPLSGYYVRMHHEDVARHIANYEGFKGLAIKDLTKGILRDWMTWAAVNGLSGNRINSILEGMRVPIRYLVFGTAPDRLIFESYVRPGQPLGETFFRNACQRELASIGIVGKYPGKRGDTPDGYVNEQERRNLTFHGLRHTFVTLGHLSGISDIEIQALAGHKDASMMNQYSHIAQVMDLNSAKTKLEAAFNGAEKELPLPPVANITQTIGGNK